MLMRDDSGLMLVGSRPSSQLNGHNSVPTDRLQTEPASPAASSAPWKVSRNTSKAYEDRILGNERHGAPNRPSSGHRNYSQRVSSKNHSVKSQYPTTRQPVSGGRACATGNVDSFSNIRKGNKRHTPSYVDEMLFGSSGNASQNMAEAWKGGMGHSGAHTERVGRADILHDHHGQADKAYPQSARPQTAMTGTKKPKKFGKHTPSYVDETLFGRKPSDPEFQAPWEDGKSPKPFHFDCTDYHGRPSSSSSMAQTRSQKPCRPVSRTGLLATVPFNGNRTGEAASPYFKPSFVDETLFGEKIDNHDGWEAPWGEKSNRRDNGVLVYDAYEHKVNINHDMATVHPQSRVLGHSRVGRQHVHGPGVRPAWK